MKFTARVHIISNPLLFLSLRGVFDTGFSPFTADPAECGSPVPSPALHCHEHDLISVRWSDALLPLDNVYMLELRPRGGVWSPASIVSTTL